MTINDGDGFINNSEQGAVSYTVAGVDLQHHGDGDVPDSVFNPDVVVSGLGNGATTVDLSSLRRRADHGDDQCEQHGRQQRKRYWRQLDQGHHQDADTNLAVTINDGDGFINNSEQGAVGSR